MRIENGLDITEIFEQIKDEFKSKPFLLAQILVYQALTASIDNKVLSSLDGLCALTYARGIIDGLLLIGGGIK